jgi:NodT family efflux transporter outer membrane factor (OMF) lipoprotein
LPEIRAEEAVIYVKMGLSAALAAWVAGCAVGPDFKTPEAPRVGAFLPSRAPDLQPGEKIQGRILVHGADVPAAWWELFRSPELNQLVRDGIAHNPDLAAAEAAVRVAYANAMAQRGALFPSVDANLEGTRQRPAGMIVDPVTSQESKTPIYNVTTRQVSVSFVPDIWGGTRRLVEAADAETESQVFQREGVYLTLASNIALAAIEEARLRGQIEATQRVINLQVQFLGVLRRQHEQGEIALPDVVTQETAVAQARLLLPPLQKELAQQRNLLAVLTGRFPSELQKPIFRLSGFRLPRKLPLSLPGDLVRQRPDVRTAEADLRGANAQIGAALAERLPQITLSGNIGKTRSNMPDLSPSGAFWMVVGNAGQKLFDAGTLYFRQQAAEEATERAIAQYRSAVLTAFQNVGDVLRALQADAASVRAAVTAERTAAQNIELIRHQFEHGQVSVPILIVAQEAYLQTSLARIDAQASRLADTVALFQALGGGWWSGGETVVADGKQVQP